MNAEEILETARTSATPPHGWIVLPLSRTKVMLGIAGWFFGFILGIGLFTLVVYAVFPSNFEHGAPIAVFTLCLLAVLLFIGFGSIWMLIQDVRRLMEVKKHMIVITPQDFVKQEGSRIITVPLMNVRHVTARGTPPPDRTAPKEPMFAQIPSMGERFGGFFMGQAATREGARTHRRRRRTPTSLAFIDTRTDNEVIVVTDGAYGDPFMIAALLKQYAASVA
ncbi:MAG: hypothetical protein NVSMB49_20610 [Ktedonobacteraceae bacterium]